MAKRLIQVHPAGAIRDRVRSLPKRFRRKAAEGVAAEWELHSEDELYTICSTNPSKVVGALPA